MAEKNNKKETNNKQETTTENGNVFTFTREVSASKEDRKNGKIFSFLLTVDGDTADALVKADNAIVSSALFSDFAINAQQSIRKQLVKNPEWNEKNIQDFANTLRPMLGQIRNVEKRIDNAKNTLRKNAQHMSAEERQELINELQAM